MEKKAPADPHRAAVYPRANSWKVSMPQADLVLLLRLAKAESPFGATPSSSAPVRRARGATRPSGWNPRAGGAVNRLHAVLCPEQPPSSGTCRTRRSLSKVELWRAPRPSSAGEGHAFFTLETATQSPPFLPRKLRDPLTTSFLRDAINSYKPTSCITFPSRRFQRTHRLPLPDYQTWGPPHN
jgi:hypothetical protein